MKNFWWIFGIILLYVGLYLGIPPFYFWWTILCSILGILDGFSRQSRILKYTGATGAMYYIIWWYFSESATLSIGLLLVFFIASHLLSALFEVILSTALDRLHLLK